MKQSRKTFRYFSELAQSYFPNSTPHSALRQLHRWIDQDPVLTEQLRELNLQPRQRSLTPLQVRAIIDAFGTPDE